LQLLTELVPHLHRVAVTSNHSNSATLNLWRAAAGAARAIGLQAVAVDIRTADELEPAVKSIPKLRADAVLVLPDPVTNLNATRVVRLIAAQRLPAIYTSDSFIAAGGLMSYGISETAIWSQAATYVDRILKGANPAELPVERPTVFDLAVNLRTARSLEIAVPESILLRATEVIK